MGMRQSTQIGYKERWQEYFDDAVEGGASEDAAGRSADTRLADYYAAGIDEARDRQKYGNI